MISIFPVLNGLFHLETLDALSADQVNDYKDYPVHVFNAEDRYETYKEPDHPGIYFRRLLWSWTLSGGSACYGGDWDDIVPYGQSTFAGLDNIIHIKNFFLENEVELSDYTSDDYCVSSSDNGAGRPKVMRMKTAASYIIYHPNASIHGQSANVNSTTASLCIDDLPASDYTLSWMRADNGLKHETNFHHEGGARILLAPWSGIDVIIYLQSNSAVSVELEHPCSSPRGSDILGVLPNPFQSSSTIWLRLTEAERVCLDIINIQGKIVDRLAYGELHSGTHHFNWNTTNRSSGIYIVKLIKCSGVYYRWINLI